MKAILPPVKSASGREQALAWFFVPLMRRDSVPMVSMYLRHPLRPFRAQKENGPLARAILKRGAQKRLGHTSATPASAAAWLLPL
ncbi:MAG: hypothetical protein A2Z95_04920 [Gallionellales bacterium GWA2_60_18]|nr:MAG: hypothetical protein A2Z95_04920 [Gallionellales bacterium GWA2_60_18]